MLRDDQSGVRTVCASKSLYYLDYALSRVRPVMLFSPLFYALFFKGAYAPDVTLCRAIMLSSGDYSTTYAPFSGEILLSKGLIDRNLPEKLLHFKLFYRLFFFLQGAIMPNLRLHNVHRFQGLRHLFRAMCFEHPQRPLTCPP